MYAFFVEFEENPISQPRFLEVWNMFSFLQ